MFKIMRFLALGTLALLCLAGCGDKGGTSATTDTDKLVIEDKTPGTGIAAKTGDTLFMEYSGKLADGTEFDSTAKRDNAPFSFVLGSGQVIKGWDQGLVGMKEGGLRKLTIPYTLGYGEQGQPPTIPASATLIFDVKLDKVLHASDMGQVLAKDVKDGSGPGIKEGDTVEVDYAGTYFNGKTFDTSKKPGGSPLKVTIGKNEVVSGFESALMGMKKGAERIATIPPEFGYGDHPPQGIPAKSWLVFDLQIVAIHPGSK